MLGPSTPPVLCTSWGALPTPLHLADPCPSLTSSTTHPRPVGTSSQSRPGAPPGHGPLWQSPVHTSVSYQSTCTPACVQEEACSRRAGASSAQTPQSTQAQLRPCAEQEAAPRTARPGRPSKQAEMGRQRPRWAPTRARPLANTISGHPPTPLPGRCCESWPGRSGGPGASKATGRVCSHPNVGFRRALPETPPSPLPEAAPRALHGAAGDEVINTVSRVTAGASPVHSMHWSHACPAGQRTFE